MNYVLIDYESVQPGDVSALKQDHYRVMVFVGARQTRIPLETAMELQEMRSNADYVKISGTGQNALDFHIAFYIGQLAEKHPKASFYIVSRDAGFDPLLKHLKTRKIRALRVKTVGEIPFPKARNDRSTADRIALIADDLKKRGAARPKTVTALTRTIGALFQKQLSSDEIGALLTALQARGYVSVVGNKISYRRL